MGATLRRRGVEPTFYTAVPAQVVTDFLPGARVRPWVADVGIAQRDSLTEDLPATLTRLEERAGEAAIDALAAELRGHDVVIVDIAPPALEAARRAGVRALAVGNFDWAWIYRHYPPLHGWAERFAAWQAGHEAVELWPGPGLTGFGVVHPGGLLGRPAPEGAPRRLGEGAAYVLVSFGGFGLADVAGMLPRLPGVRWLLAPPMPRIDREDCEYREGVPYPALVAGADVVLTKPGYGIYTEAALAGTPLVWLDRGAFPEAPYLEAAMWARGDRKVGEPAAGAVGEPERTTRSSAAFELATLAASGDGRRGGGPACGVADVPDGASDVKKRRAETGVHARIGEAIRARLGDPRPVAVVGDGAERIVNIALGD